MDNYFYDDAKKWADKIDYIKQDSEQKIITFLDGSKYILYFTDDSIKTIGNISKEFNIYLNSILNIINKTRFFNSVLEYFNLNEIKCICTYDKKTRQEINDLLGL